MIYDSRFSLSYSILSYNSCYSKVKPETSSSDARRLALVSSRFFNAVTLAIVYIFKLSLSLTISSSSVYFSAFNPATSSFTLERAALMFLISLKAPSTSLA